MIKSVWDKTVSDALSHSRQPHKRRVKVGNKSVTLDAPHPSPQDWRDHWIYFLLVDRFNNPVHAPQFAPWDGSHGGFQGGTLNGIREQLDYLKALGVGAIWLSPVFKNCQFNPGTYHGYGIQDFLQIEPRFCSDPAKADDELSALVDGAHARGMYVILDIVLNHAGDVFAYVDSQGNRVAEADWSDRPYPIAWRDQQGDARTEWSIPPNKPHAYAAVWPRELQQNAAFRRQGRGGESGGDFCSLKELVTDLTEQTAEGITRYPVRDSLIRTHQYAIAKWDIDGFRIDTLKYIEPDFARIFGNAMREFAASIGKKNFFSFGEVYDEEEQIARFIGRSASDPSDLVGVDAALDFPLFFRLPAVSKGLAAPNVIAGMFEHRKSVQRGLLSSHGDASSYFVGFLDNHDQRSRLYYRDPTDPMRYADQATLALTLLYTLQGIPCLYYGTEQGLHGSGDSDAAIREALWGKPNAFDASHPFFRMVRAVSQLRAQHPALRYGRQYFRPLSGDGTHFGLSPFPSGVVAFSRILDTTEVLVVANTHTQSAWEGEVIIDASINAPSASFVSLLGNLTDSLPASLAAITKAAGSVLIHEPNGSVTRGPARSLRVALRPMEVRVYGAR